MLLDVAAVIVVVDSVGFTALVLVVRSVDEFMWLWSRSASHFLLVLFVRLIDKFVWLRSLSRSGSRLLDDWQRGFFFVVVGVVVRRSRVLSFSTLGILRLSSSMPARHGPGLRERKSGIALESSPRRRSFRVGVRV